MNDEIYNFLFGEPDEEPKQKQAYTIDTTNIEAENRQRVEELEAAGWTVEHHQRQLIDYADFWEIPIDTTTTDPFTCLQVLVTMFQIPLEENRSERDAAVRDLQARMVTHFKLTPGGAMTPVLPHQRFYRLVMAKAVMIIDFPHWWEEIRYSIDELITLYKNLKRGTQVLELLGIGGGTTYLGNMAKDGAGEVYDGIRKKDYSNIPKKAVESMKGAAGLKGTWARRLVGGGPKGGIAGGIALGTLMLSYENGLERMEMVEDLIEIAYRENRATKDQYMSIFDVDEDQVDLQRYW